jgi:hypothetical protein
MFTFADRDCATSYPEIVNAIRAISLRPGGAAAGVEVTEEREPRARASSWRALVPVWWRLGRVAGSPGPSLTRGRTPRPRVKLACIPFPGGRPPYPPGSSLRSPNPSGRLGVLWRAA